MPGQKMTSANGDLGIKGKVRGFHRALRLEGTPGGHLVHSPAQGRSLCTLLEKPLLEGLQGWSSPRLQEAILRLINRSPLFGNSS